MRTNIAKPYQAEHTHEGAVAARITPLAQLRRSVLSCLLWENEFYEDGQSIADRVVALAMDPKVTIDDLAALAIEARHIQHLRHVPLLLLRVLIRRGAGNPIVSQAIEAVISRADELAELVSLYRADKTNRHMLPAQMKKGLARAFLKFDEYALAKYNRDAEVKLRDVLFLCHAKPDTESRADLWKRLVNNELVSPDTWEVALSSGADKKETFTRLLEEGKLGYLALLRNLRNMEQAGVDHTLVKNALIERKGANRVLPFRFVAAARVAPQFEPALDQALCASIEGSPALEGRTIILVDVSGSMQARLSEKSDMTRMDAAATLSSVIKGDLRVFSFSNTLVECPARRGMAGVDAVIKSQGHGGTNLARAIQQVNLKPHDRLIVISDEQANSFYGPIPAPKARNAYMINVASNKNGVGYGNGWIHIDGWSENVIRYIMEREAV